MFIKHNPNSTLQQEMNKTKIHVKIPVIKQSWKSCYVAQCYKS